ncbi:MAG: signal recognition particle-docking protein FtsY [Anaerolineae bacterium]
MASIRASLARTRKSVFGQIATLLGTSDIDDETWDDLEALLIQADVGVETTLKVVERMQKRVQQEGIVRADTLQRALHDELRALLIDPPPFQVDAQRLLTVVLVVGVNGSGKTTSIGKLAYRYRQLGRKVMLVAGDTFRAAAIDQLQVWGQRAGVPVIAGQPGGDPGAVLYDAIQSSRARDVDMLIVDTAGRLHTQYNLMAELKKIHGVARKNVHAAPHETLLVLDASTGQNALSQAKHFQEAVNVTGVVLAKLDGSAKGGMVLAIREALGLPVRLVGTGEGIQDLADFDPDQFIEGLFT